MLPSRLDPGDGFHAAKCRGADPSFRHHVVALHIGEQGEHRLAHIFEISTSASCALSSFTSQFPVHEISRLWNNQYANGTILEIVVRLWGRKECYVILIDDRSHQLFRRIDEVCRSSKSPRNALTHSLARMPSSVASEKKGPKIPFAFEPWCCYDNLCKSLPNFQTVLQAYKHVMTITFVEETSLID
jgi:hypothetical protein